MKYNPNNICSKFIKDGKILDIKKVPFGVPIGPFSDVN
jgi:hypothetical protein